jgi:hypothetical protein
MTACDSTTDTSNTKLQEAYKTYTESVDSTTSYEDWVSYIIETSTTGGQKGADGLTPSIGENGNWYLGTQDTGVKAAGSTPVIGENGNWFIDGADTGVKAAGAEGNQGLSAYEVYLSTLGTNDKILTKAEWLDSLKGASGAAGKDGKEGSDGVGISKVEFAADGSGLLIYYTDNPTEGVLVKFPEVETHEHKYGDVVAIIEPTVYKEGIGYQTCSDTTCGETELVVIPKLGYEVVVYLNDGKTPAANATVTIGDTPVITNDEGVAQFTELARGDYEFSVEKEGYVFVDKVDTTKDAEIKVVLAKELDETATISGAGVYAITSTYSYSQWWGAEYDEVVVTFAAGDEDVKYKVTINSDYGYALVDYTSVESPELIIEAGKTATVTFGVDSYADGVPESDVTYTITVEALEAPEKGTVKEFARTVELGEDMTIETSAETLYFTLNPYTQYGSTQKNYAMTFDESKLAVEFLFTGYDDDWNYISETVNVQSGVPFTIANAYGETMFTVTVKDSSAQTLKVENYYYKGEVKNPYEVTELGVANTQEVSSASYFKYTVETAGKYTVVLSSGTQVTVYKNIDITKSSWNWTSAGYVASDTKKGVFEFAEGDEVYFYVYPDDNGNVSFTLKVYDEESDAGYSSNTAIDLTGKTEAVTVTDVASSMYFKYTASAYGRLTIKVTDKNGNAVTYEDIYDKDSDGVAPVKTASTIWFGNSSNIQVSSASVLLDADASQSIRISLNSLCAATTYKVEAIFTPIVAVDHKVTVKDSDGAVAGVKVVATSGGAEVASGTTDENGEVTLKMIPGVYSLQFENLSDDYYYGSIVHTEFPADGSKDNGSNYEIVLEKTTSHTITVKVAGTATKDLTVTVNNAKGSKVAQGTTDENGNVTLKFVAGDENTISISGYDDDEYYCDDVTTTADVASYTVNVLAKVQYKVNVSLEDGAELTGTIYVKLQWGSWAYQAASATVDESGVATFEDKYKPGVYAITINDSYVPEGYYFVAVSTTADSDTVNVVLKKKATYTITVKNGEEVVAGATVALSDGTSATTDESGVATIVTIPAALTASVTLPESLAADYYVANVSIAEGTTSATVSVVAKVAYTVTVQDDEGTKLANAVVTLTGSDGNTYSATTGEDGTISVKAIPGVEYAVSIKLKGYKGSTTIATDATSGTVTAEVQTSDPMLGTHSFTGTEGECAITVQVDGTYTLTFANQNYTFISVNGSRDIKSGSYTVTLKEGDVLSVWGMGGASGSFEITEVQS